MAERDLRRMVVDLAALVPEDREAVLGELDAPQRRTVERLLAEFSGGGFAEEVAAEAVPGCDSAKLSPWLADRMSERSTMTAHAREALRKSAMALFPKTDAPARQPGLFARLTGLGKA
ncbi:MAG TPA: hypothetical protein VG889_09595 [Rhizomicrobium sp.]|nr:hypothetical protein [Rhizomicrobium sp.]